MDGWVIVGTKLDSKQLEKDIKNAERRLQQYQKEAENLAKSKAKAEIDLQSYEEEKRTIQQITDEMNQCAQTEQEVINNLEMEKAQLEELKQKYSKQINNLDEINQKIKENAKNQSLVNNEIDETNRKLNQAKGVTSIKDVINNINKSTGDTIKKVSRWALAIFGLRSAYMFIRQSASTLAQYNDQIAKDLEYMQFALANMLKPLIEGLINLAYKLLTYVNYIAKAWFGVDLFANSSAKAMNKASQSAEKMKKSLAGFDEMNVLNENGSTGAMGAVAPSFDLSNPEDVPIPTWIKWIADNKDIVIAGLIGIAGGLTAVHLGLSLIQGLGIGIALAGIIFAIQNLIQFLNDPTFNTFIGIVEGIGIAVLGVGIAISSLPVAVAGAVIAIVGLVVENYDKIMRLFDKALNWLETVFLPILRKLFGPLGDMMLQPILYAVNVAKGAFEGFYGGIKTIVNGIVEIFKGNFKSGITKVFTGLKSIVLAPINALISGINSLIKGINKISFDVPDWVPLIGGKKWGFDIPQIPKLKVGGIINMPGRGVPVGYGRAIGGEAGKEGVLPLTDSQAMEELGSAIGRYITINLTNNTNLDGRRIARQQTKVQANRNFAMNR